MRNPKSSRLRGGVEAAGISPHRSDHGVFFVEVIEDFGVRDAEEPAVVDADAGAEDAESGQDVPLALGCALPVAVGVCWLGDDAAVVAAGAAAGTDALAC